MSGKIGFGALFKHDSGSGVYVTVANVTKIRPYGLKADTIDISDHESPSRYREKTAGMLDSGSCAIDLNYEQDETTHQLMESSVGTTKNYRIVFPGTGRTATFSGFIESTTPELPFDNKMTCTVNVQISGVVTWAAAA
jgi:predicted secreted protein